MLGTHRDLWARASRSLVAVVALGAALVATTAHAAGADAPVGLGIVTPSAVLPDPMAHGDLAVKVAHYEGGPTVVVDPQGLTYAAELAGTATYPAPGAGDGPFPVVLLLHGNHGTCTIGGADAVGWPCPSTPATEQIPNHAGYQGLAESLASNGYIVLSLDANAVNTYNVAGDRGANERAQLLERTLDLLGARNGAAGVTSPGTTGSVDEMGGDLVGRVDLTRVGMMGHSRGGEAVNAAIEHLRARTDGPTYDGALKAVISLAGTDYNLPVTSGTNHATILPLCDGDVYDLQSVFAWDRHRLDDPATPFDRTLWTIGGTNHNYFNTVWTGDDYGGADAACSRASGSSARLLPAEQRAVGDALMAAYLRRHVGPEPAFAPYVTGAAILPSTACPASRPCEGLVTTAHLAPGASRTFIGPSATADPLARSSLGTPVTASGWTTFSSCDPAADNGRDGNNRDPGKRSGCPTNPHRSRARQWTLAWDSPAAHLGIPVPSGAVAGGDGALVVSFRAASNHLDAANRVGGPDLAVTLVDAAGHRDTRRVSASSTALVPPPGDVFRKQTMNGVRIPVSAFEGVDPATITSVVLSPASPTGSVQVADLVLQRESASDPAPVVPELPTGPVLLGVAALGAIVVVRRHRRTASAL